MDERSKHKARRIREINYYVKKGVVDIGGGAAINSFQGNAESIHSGGRWKGGIFWDTFTKEV